MLTSKLENQVKLLIEYWDGENSRTFQKKKDQQIINLMEDLIK